MARLRAALGAAVAAGFAFGALAFAPAAALAQQDVLFLSTQLRPIEEAQKMREAILRGAPARVTFVTEEPPQFNVRMRAETQAGRRTISLVGALHGELSPLVAMGALRPSPELARLAAGRGVPPGLMQLGRLGTQEQLYIPWMQATYVMAANRRALEFLPAGADVNALTYDQLAQWADAIRERTGQRRLGFPAGPRGLMPRFFQGYLSPAYTGGVVTPFRGAEAEAAWERLRTMWASVNPNSAAYNFMQEPLAAGEVWIAWDHVARLLDALRDRPGDYVVFPPPAGPRGRAYMPVVAGLAVVQGGPNPAGAAQVVDWLTRPEVQARTAAETGFFPVVRADLPADLNPGVRLAADGIARTQSAPDALPALLPVGLGDKGGEFNKVFMDAFQRIVLRREPVRAVLDQQAEVLRALMRETGAPCWAPDAPSGDAPCPVN